MTEAGEASKRETLIAPARAWCGRQPVRLDVLFGTQARRQVHPGSGVDLAVWPEHSPAPGQGLRRNGALEVCMASLAATRTILVHAYEEID